MTASPAPVDAVVELCVALAYKEADEIMGGPEHIVMNDLTPCEMVGLLAIIRPAYERRAAAQKQPAPVLELVRSSTRRRR
jgi:hypothetical protein